MFLLRKENNQVFHIPSIYCSSFLGFSSLCDSEQCPDKTTDAVCETIKVNYANTLMVILSLRAFLVWHISVFLVPVICFWSLKTAFHENTNNIVLMECGPRLRGNGRRQLLPWCILVNPHRINFVQNKE